MANRSQPYFFVLVGGLQSLRNRKMKSLRRWSPSLSKAATHLPSSIIYCLILALTLSVFTCNHPGCMCRPPNWNNPAISHLTQALFYVSGLPSSLKKMAGDFNIRKACWFSSSVLPTLLNLVRETHAYGWTQHLTTPKRLHSILDLHFTHSTPDFRFSVRKPFLRSCHKTIKCNFLIRVKSSPPMYTDYTFSFSISNR